MKNDSCHIQMDSLFFAYTYNDNILVILNLSWIPQLSAEEKKNSLEQINLCLLVLDLACDHAGWLAKPLHDHVLLHFQ